MHQAGDTLTERIAIRSMSYADVVRMHGMRYTRLRLSTPGELVVRRDGDISHQLMI